MDDPKQPPEAFSKQSVGMMMGGIVGALLAMRLIFSNYDAYVGTGQFPWVTALGMTLGGCVVGLILAVLFTGETSEEDKEKPADPQPSVEPPAPQTHIKPTDNVEGVRADSPRLPTNPDT
jgi:hypothetical protein